MVKLLRKGNDMKKAAKITAGVNSIKLIGTLFLYTM